jgi:hypothetical protein
VNFDFSFACAAISKASSETSNENVSSAVSIEMIAGFIQFTPFMIPEHPEVLPPDFSVEFSDFVGARELHAWNCSLALQANPILSGI